MIKKSFVFLAVGIALVFTSCEENEATPIGNYLRETPSIILTPEEYASVAYSGNNELSETEVTDIAQLFIRRISRNTKSADGISVMVGEKVEVTDLQTKAETGRPVYAYYVNIQNGDNQGTALVSADKRVPEVLAYTPQTRPVDYPFCLGTEIMTEVAKQAMLHQIERCEHLRDSLETATLEKVARQYGKESVTFEDFEHDIYIDNYGYADEEAGPVEPVGEVTHTVGPFTARTAWDQVYPYNALLDESDAEGLQGIYRGHFGVGCATVAAAQVMAVYQPQVNADGVNIDWEYLLEDEQIFEDETEKVHQVASLIRYISLETNTRFTDTGSWTTMPEMRDFLKRYSIEMDNARAGLMVARLKASLDDNRMVWVTGTTSGNSRGKRGYHAWIIDGYQTTRKNTKELLKSYNMYVHANMGWGGFDTGYYLVGDDQSLVFNTQEAGAYNTDVEMYCNIRYTR